MLTSVAASKESRVPATSGVASVGAVSWKLQREIALLMAWGPSILLQFAHPLGARGVADHSAFRVEPLGRTRRFYRTLDAMLRLSFGTAQDALDVVGRINAIHDRVHGTLGEPAGAFPAGTRYSARDPALLRWVHATLVDMNLRVYELFVGRLPAAEQDRYCLEASGVEEQFGIPEGWLPRSVDELRDYVAATLASGEIAVTDTARALAAAVVDPPMV